MFKFIIANNRNNQTIFQKNCEKKKMEENLSQLFADTKLKKINDFLAHIESFYAFFVVLVGLIGNSISFYLFVTTKLR
jgi:hypothetical protein